MTRKLLFVGAVNRLAPPANGEEYKNQMLLGFLDERFRVYTIDTKSWSKEPLTLLKLLFHMLFVRYDRILISASSASVFRLLDTLRFFQNRMRKVIYFVIGGYLPKAIREGRYNKRAYQKISSLVVEGEIMKNELKNLGVTAPIHVVPNFKTVKKCWGDPIKFDSTESKFVFVSRISESKGLDKIFSGISDGRFDQLNNRYTIDFFGPIEKGYETEFHQQLQKYPTCVYRGYLDFTNHPEKSYQQLSEYHIMLFPTYWVGEGFPGAIIDALICGIPVIASDWNMNREVIEHGKTGMLIPVKDPVSLADAMIDAIENHEKWKSMSMECHRRATKFDTNVVLEEHLEYII